MKDGAGWAVGTAIAVLVHAIVLDQRRMLPVSSLQTGTYGLSDVCLSVPTIVGYKGIVKHLEMELWSRELQELKNSAKSSKKDPFTSTALTHDSYKSGLS